MKTGIEVRTYQNDDRVLRPLKKEECLYYLLLTIFRIFKLKDKLSRDYGRASDTPEKTLAGLA